jgi:hypothetical protein
MAHRVGERESLVVDRIRDAEKALTGWSNKGGEPIPMRSLLLEAAARIEYLESKLAEYDKYVGEFTNGA